MTPLMGDRRRWQERCRNCRHAGWLVHVAACGQRFLSMTRVSCDQVPKGARPAVRDAFGTCPLFERRRGREQGFQASAARGAALLRETGGTMEEKTFCEQNGCWCGGWDAPDGYRWCEECQRWVKAPVEEGIGAPRPCPPVPERA